MDNQVMTIGDPASSAVDSPIFYVYLHCKPDGTPFYVGKGCGKRSRQFSSKRNQFYKNIVKKYGKENIVVDLFNCVSEADSFDLEKILIKFLRESCVEITNLTDGGEGASGWTPTEETRLKMSKASSDKWADKDFKEKTSIAIKNGLNKDGVQEKRRASISTTFQCPEYKKARSIAMKKLWVNNEYRNKILKSRKNNKETEEQKQKRIAKSTATKRLPEARAKTAEQTRLRWLDPVFIEKMRLIRESKKVLKK